MAISNEQLQEKLMDMLRVIESADPATKELDELRPEQGADEVGTEIGPGRSAAVLR